MDCSKLAVDKLQRFWRLSATERRLLLRAMVLLPLTGVALRLVGFRCWQAALARLAPAGARLSDDPCQDSLERACVTARMVQAAERHGLGRPNCLRQSMVLWCLLCRQGVAAELRVGGRKQDGRFEAHAWVEHRGVALNDREELRQHYAPFQGSLAAASRRVRTEPQ
ncbi:MAG: lasso peptide biosynthesis B2 protein [Acidobacteria bacterium]|nr:MAG: lasso peptide biosynthesis B2 protein [Acidobacteriota bacterium]